ncbi:MAG: peptidylprolyl isomerase [Bacteroidia bacterium]
MKKVFVLLLFPFAVMAHEPEVKSLHGTALPVQKKYFPDDASREEAKKRLEGYRQQVLKGESMGTLAAMYSDDPGSAKQGGMYQNVVPGAMVAEFEKVAFSLKPGDVSEIFETQFGFHFIQLISRNGDSLNLRHILIIPK